MGKSRKNNPAQKKRKARLAALDADIASAQKRARVRGRRDDELFRVDHTGTGAGAHGAPGRRKKQRAAATAALTAAAVGGVPSVLVGGAAFEAAPTRPMRPAPAKNLNKSKRVGSDRHLQGPTQVRDADLFDAWGDEAAAAPGGAGSTVRNHGSTNWRGQIDGWTAGLVHRPAVRHSARLPSTASNLRAADVAPEGASYNPEVRAYAELVSKATASEVLRRRRLAQLEDALHPAVPPTDPSLVASSDEEDDEGEEAAVAAGAVATGAALAKPKKKLTTAQRNAQARQKEQQRAARARQEAKVLNSQLAHLKELNKGLQREARDKEDKRKRIDEWRAERARTEAPLRFGGKAASAQPEVKPVDAVALPGNMRNIRASGNAVLDRMHNLLRRNVIEQGRKVRPRKPKVKHLERDRDWALEVAASSDEEGGEA